VLVETTTKMIVSGAASTGAAEKPSWILHARHTGATCAEADVPWKCGSATARNSAVALAPTTALISVRDRPARLIRNPVYDRVPDVSTRSYNTR
jgi:hypothetical protein